MATSTEEVSCNPFAVEQPYEFFEGDIVLDVDTKRRIERNRKLHDLRAHSKQRDRRAIVKQSTRLWKDGVVPFRMDHKLRTYCDLCLTKFMLT